MNSNEKMFLFDMDGTLTPPRGRITNKMISSLRKLSEIGRIGVVTGSDFDYVWDQMSYAFDIGGVPVDRIDIMPCNGTKKYVTNPSRNFKLVHEAKMVEEIGREPYGSIMRWCAGWQWDIMTTHQDLPYTGTFIQCRGSLVNWSPIGRAANDDERKSWIERDNEKEIRKYYSRLLSENFLLHDIKATAALGGSTSIDIYPQGWDKTYALQHCADKDVYFTGDKCEPGGNDWHIYEALKGSGKAFKVQSPEDTIKVIEKLISSS